MLPLEALKQFWGYPAFRPLQKEIIDAVLAGRDTLALLPTGGGKSLCYQVPAMCMDGLCLVVSPLIALMKDQVDNLRKRGIAAAAVYSGMNYRAIDITLENACQGAYKLLYVSPERLFSDMMRERLPRMPVALLAVDEAHCISQWGYDFRPPYLRLAELRPLLPKVPIVALTATATPKVVEDIQDKLAFREAMVFQQSFVRDNLSYSVLYEEKKREKLIDILRNVPGTGIVYMRSRGETREMVQWLHHNRISADFYHAGLSTEEREARQQAWMDNRTRIIVCTNAFGMGIDKPDVRIVVHLALPDSLEAYFQEAGRAGRDGQKSYAVLLYGAKDGERLRAKTLASFPPPEEVQRIYRALGSYTQVAIGAGSGENFDFDFQHFCMSFKLEMAPTHAALRLLEQDGWIALSESAAAPARLLVLADRETLYDYQLKNRASDPVIKALLRLYPGIQHEHANISEKQLAEACRLDIPQIKKVLEKAHAEQVLEYLPASDKPQITFLRERVAAENMVLNMDRFLFRKNNALERMEQVIRYAETLQCRSKQLVTYFGETEAPLCGRCDVCTGRNKPEGLSEETFENTAKKIRMVLRDGPLSKEELLSAFAMKKHPLIAEVLQYMLEEGMLEASGDKLGLADG